MAGAVAGGGGSALAASKPAGWLRTRLTSHLPRLPAAAARYTFPVRAVAGPDMVAITQMLGELAQRGARCQREGRPGRTNPLTKEHNGIHRALQ